MLSLPIYYSPVVPKKAFNGNNTQNPKKDTGVTREFAFSSGVFKGVREVLRGREGGDELKAKWDAETLLLSHSRVNQLRGRGILQMLIFIKICLEQKKKEILCFFIQPPLLRLNPQSDVAQSPPNPSNPDPDPSPNPNRRGTPRL